MLSITITACERLSCRLFKPWMFCYFANGTYPSLLFFCFNRWEVDVRDGIRSCIFCRHYVLVSWGKMAVGCFVEFVSSTAVYCLYVVSRCGFLLLFCQNLDFKYRYKSSIWYTRITMIVVGWALVSQVPVTDKCTRKTFVIAMIYSFWSFSICCFQRNLVPWERKRRHRFW